MAITAHAATLSEGKFPFGSVPVLEVDKGDGSAPETYAQSVGILRYVGRLGGE